MRFQYGATRKGLNFQGKDIFKLIFHNKAGFFHGGHHVVGQQQRKKSFATVTTAYKMLDCYGGDLETHDTSLIPPILTDLPMQNFPGQNRLAVQIQDRTNTKVLVEGCY